MDKTVHVHIGFFDTHFFQRFHETFDLKLQTCTHTHLLTAAIKHTLVLSHIIFS